VESKFPFNYIIYREPNYSGFMFSWRRGESFTIDMSHYSSAMVINISLILGQVNFVGDLDKTEFNRSECSELTQIPARRILFYAEQEGLLTRIKKPGGHGRARKYNRKDIAELLLIKELARRGVTVSEMGLIADQFRQQKDEWWNSRKQDYIRS